MKRMRISGGRLFNSIGILMVVTVIFAACKTEVTPEPEPEEPKPTAGFEYTQVSEDDPFTFSFTNNGTNFKEVRWEFGDDSSSLEVAPVHTFLGTGEFRVKMRVENGQGYWAQQEEVITISADSIINLVTTRKGDGTLDLSVSSDMTIDSIDWFLGVGTDLTHLSSEREINIAVETGQFQDYTIQVHSSKGSRARVSRLLTDLGIVRDVTNINSNLRVSRDNDGGPHAGEGSLKLTDNATNTKFLQFNYVGDLWFELEFYEPVVLGAYTFTSANDAPGRDPKNWRLEATSDGENWTVLDTREDEVFENRFQTRTFTFDNSTAYTRYRVYVTAVGSGGLFQLAEWRVLELPQDED